MYRQLRLWGLLCCRRRAAIGAAAIPRKAFKFAAAVAFKERRQLAAAVSNVCLRQQQRLGEDNPWGCCEVVV